MVGQVGGAVCNFFLKTRRSLNALYLSILKHKASRNEMKSKQLLRLVVPHSGDAQSLASSHMMPAEASERLEEDVENKMHFPDDLIHCAIYSGGRNTQ